MSLGMETAGCALLGHIEIDEAAAASYALTFEAPVEALPGIGHDQRVRISRRRLHCAPESTC